MKINTINSLAPPIIQMFDKFLLVPWDGIMDRYDKLKQKCLRKIPESHIGRRREFDKMSMELNELYGKAKINQG